MIGMRTCEGCGCPVEEPALILEQRPGEMVAVCLGCQEQFRAIIRQVAVVLPAYFAALGKAFEQAAEACRRLSQKLEKHA